jgi:hypothetical protein
MILRKSFPIYKNLSEMKKIILKIVGTLFIIGMIFDCCNYITKTEQSESITIDEAIKNYDFQTCNEMLTDIYNRYVDSPRSYEIADTYIPHAIKVLKAEGSYLIDIDNADAEKLFLLCLNDVIANIGGFRPEEKKTESHDYNNTQYKACITPLNGCLLALIREALIKDNLSFAEKITPFIQVNIKSNVKNESTFGGDYTYTFDYSDQQTAQKLIKEYKSKNKKN